MVKDFEDTLGAGMLKAVVEGGEGKKLQKTESIDRRADDPWGVIAFYGKGYHDRNADDAKNNPETVDDAVYEF